MSGKPELLLRDTLDLDSFTSNQVPSPSAMVKIEESSSPEHLPRVAPTRWVFNEHSEDAHSPPRPFVEDLYDPVELAQHLSTYHDDRLLPPCHPDVVALITYKAALEAQYARGVRALHTALRQDLARAQQGDMDRIQGSLPGMSEFKDGDDPDLLKPVSGLPLPDLSHAENTRFGVLRSTFNAPPSPCSDTELDTSDTDNDQDHPIPVIPELPPAPYINWSKYWVCGESLHKIHQDVLAGRTPKYRSAEDHASIAQGAR